MTYQEQLLQLKESIEQKFPNTKWELDTDSWLIIEQTDYFKRYVQRILKYTSFSPEPFLRHLLQQELGLEDIVVFGDGIDEWFGLTID